MVKRTSRVVAWTFALVARASVASADVGPPPRTECYGTNGPCWIDGKLAGACIEGVCRYGAVPAPSASTSTATQTERSTDGCALEPRSGSSRELFVVGLGVAVAVVIARRRAR